LYIKGFLKKRKLDVQNFIKIGRILRQSSRAGVKGALWHKKPPVFGSQAVKNEGKNQPFTRAAG